MPRSLDFNWNEGEDGFDPKNADYQPPPAPMAASRQPSPAEPLPMDAPQMDRGPRVGRLALLALGIALGMVVGLAVLSWQGQAAARADLTPLFTLQQQALAAGDQDLYGSLLDSSIPEFRAAMLAEMATTARVFDEESPPRLRRLRIAGDKADVEVETTYEDSAGATRTYRRVETAHRSGGQWRLAPPDPADWGEILTEEGQNVTLHVHQRDADLRRLLPRLDALTQAFCRRYNPPPPCHVDLTLAPDPALLPFRAGAGATPPPPLISYESATYNDFIVISLNGMGQENDDPGFLDIVRTALPQLRGANDLLVLDQSAPNAVSISAERLTGQTIPLRFISPRLVGLHRREPHPLWWLGVSESIGDVIARRAMGPVTGEAEAVLTAWSVLRGDVAVWAERFSGVKLPAGDANAWHDDPSDIGIDLAIARTGQRQAARRLALNIHARFGEAKTLAWLLSLRGQMLNDSSTTIDGQTIGQLRQDWLAWLTS